MTCVREPQTRSVQAYSTWKKVLKYSYDFVYSKALDWPSLTCEWHPFKYPVPSGYKLDIPKGVTGSWQRLIVGTHTLNEQNFLMIIGMFIPDPTGLRSMDVGGEMRGDAEFGGFRAMPSVCRVELKIPHRGEVNRARHMPSEPRLIASKAPIPEVLIFDFLKQRSPPGRYGFGTTNDCEPELRLTGHSSEGYGIDWNALKPGHLVSGSDDGTVCIWDVNKRSGAHRTVDALVSYKAHSTVVEDVSWNKFQAHVFYSVGDDRSIATWDVRANTDKATCVVPSAHSNEINCVDCSPFSEFGLVTGSADKLVSVWDVRNMSASHCTLRGHSDEVFQVQWSPHFREIIASCGSDAHVIAWDVNKAQHADERNMDPEHPLNKPEIKFVHRGHGTKISDFNWSKSTPWAACSTSADNAMQVWKPAFTARRG